MNRWQKVLDDALEEFGAETGTLHLLEDGVLVLQAHAGIPEAILPVVSSIAVGKGMAGLAAQRNAPVDSCNIQVDDTGNVRPGARATGAQGALTVPMRDAQGAVAGTLGIACPEERAWTAAETSRLLALASGLVAADGVVLEP